MQEIYERIFVANGFSCVKGNSELAVVHACKSPCHQSAVGYRGKLPNTHPNYLVKEVRHKESIYELTPSGN